MDAFIYLVMAYSVIWLGIFGFMWFINGRTVKLEQDLTLLKEMLEKNK